MARNHLVGRSPIHLSVLGRASQQAQVCVNKSSIAAVSNGKANNIVHKAILKGAMKSALPYKNFNAAISTDEANNVYRVEQT